MKRLRLQSTDWDPNSEKKKVQADQTLLYVSRGSFRRKMLKSHSICLVLDFQDKYNCQFDKFPKRPFTLAQWACHFMRRTCPLESSRFQRSYGETNTEAMDSGVLVPNFLLSKASIFQIANSKGYRKVDVRCFFFKRYWPLTETPPGSSRTETPSGWKCWKLPRWNDDLPTVSARQSASNSPWWKN